MGILSWLKRPRPVDLDEDDFKDEIRCARCGISERRQASDVHAT